MKRPRRTVSPAPIALEIEKLVYGGAGLARSGGVTYFVPFVLPGEAIQARPVEGKKNFVRAEVVEVQRPAPGRVAAPCPYFTVCGGCQYQHIGYEHQLEAKREILRETLARLGGVSWDGPIALHASPPFGYRNRAQWKVRPLTNAAGEGESKGRALALGYFRAGSNDFCAVDQCGLLAPPLAEALEALRKELASGRLPSAIREIEAFAEPGGSLLVNVSLPTLPETPRRLFQRLREVLPALGSLLLQETAGERMQLEGQGYLNYPVGDATYRVGHMSFFQVNRFLLEEMTQSVAHGPAGGLALDLYAGAGLFSVPLGKRFERVVAVEADPAAARDLEANLKNAGIAGQALNSDAATFLADWKQQPDLVILDPPRAGVESDVLRSIAELKPPQITYISCDPATLARDLKQMRSAGYRISAIELFDVFPQTFHIETLVHLTPEP
ncbi:MAG TPA: 23S rRNA (uracil(1939)-C(5))-methyltransferase RlmD [Patescibacteria group bacterium]|nr:23S rRNA (uracil(1939)-C(5))-methyltransferase RlmD [Patescibacteria group bacterium]